jgi:hypothetical protein
MRHGEHDEIAAADFRAKNAPAALDAPPPATPPFLIPDA